MRQEHTETGTYGGAGQSDVQAGQRSAASRAGLLAGRNEAPPPLTYISLTERPLRRLPQLFAGLALYGFSLSLMVRASLGVNPWSVLYDGLARRTPLSFGLISAVVGVLVLVLWIPLRQRPTFGTGANVVVLACSADLGLWLLPQHLGLPVRIGLLVGGVLLNGLSVAVYVGARLGPGPRDGLMTGVSAAAGRSLRSVRTLIEVAVLAVGWALGGSVGAGTLVYAFAVGPVTQFFVPWFAYRGVAGQRNRPPRRCPGTRSRPFR
ncbi:YitT family protein [Streptomyces sp. NPDC018019]|uniref:membrane protein YczE n=1 Tax=Streptomyces sp. NPDC018019 TaxID=3365030 RepID=UPI0037BC5BFA